MLQSYIVYYYVHLGIYVTHDNIIRYDIGITLQYYSYNIDTMSVVNSYALRMINQYISALLSIVITHRIVFNVYEFMVII